MKRIVASMLLAAMLLGLWGCGSEKIPEETPAVTAAVTQPAETAVPETTAQAQTLPAMEDGFLYLTVSGITFGVVGDSEDIYTGTVARENVTWGSMDESIAAFSEGVVTATGVGETTIFAEYGEERLECKVSCLTADEESFSQLDRKTLRTARRMPPAVRGIAPDFYNDAAIVGDSITYIMFQWHVRNGGLGSPLFLCRGGTGINGLAMRYKQIFYQGHEMHLEDALEKSGVKKVFIMLGQNDLSFMSIEQTMEKWELLLEQIRSKTPDIEIYFQSVIPEWLEDTASNEKNRKIEAHNVLLKAFAEEKGCHYVQIAPYVVDHADKLATAYSMDMSIHMNDDGCAVWVQALQAYAEYQMLKGEAK